MDQSIDLSDTSQNAAYLVGATDLDTLDAAAHAEGHLVRRISLAGCHAKDDLLQRIAKALAFPKTFGANWDALADCLGDLAWLPQAGGYAWLFDHAGDLRDTSESDFDTLCDILDGACKRWQDRDTPCFAFLALPDDAFPVRVSSGAR
ncbi:MAG: Barstar, ribonuclease (Barnase) inhibitor [Rhodanobacteraceae bacterium]|jgi:RNAse (barnase) inhibitor barstar|nr:MAG: Barstar, ribonuclease (Barnase) inhibitor [Rhodanobacteraceae bacterium]